MTDSTGWSAFASKKTTHGSNAFQEREATVAALAARKERHRYEEAVNINSESAYPSLGSATTKPILTLNYKAAALTKPVKPEPEPEPEPTLMAKKDKGKDKTKDRSRSEFHHHLTLASDGQFEYSEEEEEDEEYNADTIATTRRGDKGLW